MSNTPPNHGPDDTTEPETAGWREPDPPPEIPQTLRESPSSARPKPDSPRTSWGETAKAWAVAFDFIVTILAGAALGWAGATWIGGPLALWVMGGLGLGFAMALTRIIRQTLRTERAEAERAKGGGHPSR